MSNLIDYYENEPEDENVRLLDDDPVKFTADCQTNTGISWYFAMFLIVNAALGAGLLNFAKAFDSAGGILYSSIIHFILLIIVVAAMYMCSFSAEKSQSSSFQDIIQAMCGVHWQTFNSVCIILYMFGCCVTFLILIGDQLEQVITCLFGASSLEHWCFQRKFSVTITSIILILPLCYPKRIDFLTVPSFLAVIAVIYVVAFTPVKYFQSKIENVQIKTRPDNWVDIFNVVPTICFGYQCHVNAIPVYACLKIKTQKEFSKAIIVSFILLFFCYQTTATFGYLTFGTKVSDDLLQSYDSSEPAVLIALLMYLFKTYTSYPLNLFCARTAIESLWIKAFNLNRLEQNQSEKTRRLSIVTIWFIISLLTALFIPNITVVIRYLGALAATFMFIFPGLCILTVAFESNFLIKMPVRTWLLIIVSVTYVAIGTFIVGLVVTQSILHDLKIF